MSKFDFKLQTFELLKNEAETLVFAELERQLAALAAQPAQELCRCDECILDMAAMALNAVKPLYQVSLLGSLYTSGIMHSDEGYAQSVRDAVEAAIERVRANPSHPQP